jgi:LuxR family maltose regulon positive regulatory protein
MAYENDSATVPQPMHVQEMLVSARLLVAEGDTKGARAILESCRDQAHAQGRGYIELETMVLAALCDERDGEVAQAQQTLIAALECAQFEGYQRLFLDEGASLLPLVRRVIEVLDPSSLRRYAQQLLESLGGIPPSHDAPICPPEPLTPQEQRVLHLLMAGHSNHEMAQMFVVSVNTIKTQVKSIYRKLNVSNRLQAANVARQLPTG